MFRQSPASCSNLSKLTMRPLRKRIREFSGLTGPYTIKAKVIEITNVHSALDGQALEFQTAAFQDEEGTKMKTYLYNEALEIFEDAFREDIEYDISNASLKQVYDKYSDDSDGQNYEIFFNINTIIRPVSDLKAPASPNYVLIGSIPRIISLDDRYDVLGVVIYVDRFCQISGYNSQPLDVCEVVIVDHSHEQVMVIIAWSELAIKDCAALHATAATFPVVGFTVLMPSYKKGFSLSTTHASFIILDPPGEQASSLKAWARENRNMLAAKNQQIFEVRLPATTRIITTVESLLGKKSHWLHVKLNDFNSKNVHLYLGCSICGTGSGHEVGVTYMCTACLSENATSTPRMTITFEAADETGDYTFTAYIVNAEKLVKMKAAALYSMPVQEREGYLKYIEDKLEKARIYIQAVPTTALSRTQHLKWVLKQISLD